jgi:GTP-binding protein
MRVMTTPLLTRSMERALQAHQPPLVRGRRIKLRYAHQGGKNPPRIIVHGNQTAHVPDAYTRYLANVFRRDFDLYATPVSVEYRTEGNPYDKRRKAEHAAKVAAEGRTARGGRKRAPRRATPRA